jgi:hypothetical protein
MVGEMKGWSGRRTGYKGGAGEYTDEYRALTMELLDMRYVAKQERRERSGGVSG